MSYYGNSLQPKTSGAANLGKALWKCVGEACELCKGALCSSRGPRNPQPQTSRISKESYNKKIEIAQIICNYLKNSMAYPEKPSANANSCLSYAEQALNDGVQNLIWYENLLPYQQTEIKNLIDEYHRIRNRELSTPGALAYRTRRGSVVGNVQRGLQGAKRTRRNRSKRRSSRRN